MLEKVVHNKSGMARIGRAAAIWLAMGLGGLVLSDVGADVCALAAALGVLAALADRQAALALPIAASILDPALLPWTLAAAAVAATPRATVAQPRLDSDPQRQLMRSRRRNEQASVLVARARGLSASQERDLLAAFRTTDAVEVATVGDLCEVRAVFDGEDVDRGAFERRVIAVPAAAELSFGWASFPADGVTLDTLIEHARGRLRARGMASTTTDSLRGHGSAQTAASIAQAS